MSRGQHPQHVIQVHVHLAQVEVLQCRGEAWGGSIRERAISVGLCTPSLSLAGALPAGCSGVHLLGSQRCHQRQCTCTDLGAGATRTPSVPKGTEGEVEENSPLRKDAPVSRSPESVPQGSSPKQGSLVLQGGDCPNMCGMLCACRGGWCLSWE